MKLFGVNLQEQAADRVIDPQNKNFNAFTCINHYGKVDNTNKSYLYTYIKQELLKDPTIIYLCFAITLNGSLYYEAKPVLDDLNGHLKGFIYFADNQYIYLPVPDSMTTENHIGLDIYALYWQEPEAE